MKKDYRKNVVCSNTIWEETAMKVTAEISETVCAWSTLVNEDLKSLLVEAGIPKEEVESLIKEIQEKEIHKLDEIDILLERVFRMVLLLLTENGPSLKIIEALQMLLSKEQAELLFPNLEDISTTYQTYDKQRLLRKQ